MRSEKGLTMLEVLIALVILGVIATIFATTTRISQRIAGRSSSWDQEGNAIIKTIENFRVDYTLAQLRSLESTWVDTRGQYPIQIHVKGATPTAADCPGYPVTLLAKMRVDVKRQTQPVDSITVTTFVLVP